jgi:hypothetical protein
MGVGLMLLLTKSTTELSKMVELRKEMETLLIDLKNEIKKKNVPTSAENSNNAPVSLSTSGGNDHSSDCIIPLQEDGASNHTDDRLDRGVAELEEMEAELEVELKRLQLTEEISALPPLLIGKIEVTLLDFNQLSLFSESLIHTAIWIYRTKIIHEEIMSQPCDNLA